MKNQFTLTKLPRLNPKWTVQDDPTMQTRTCEAAIFPTLAIGRIPVYG